MCLLSTLLTLLAIAIAIASETRTTIHTIHKKMQSMHMGEILHNNSRERQNLELQIRTDIHMPTQKKIPTL